MIRRATLMSIAVAFCAVVLLILPAILWAHCDTLDGPVVKDAITALGKRDVTPVLKWVMPEHEPEIRQAFDQTLAVRKLSPQARVLADRYFFETLVRLHRAGEGAPYTGLKPAGSVEPIVAAADKALAAGSADELIKNLSVAVKAGIQKHLIRCAEAKKHADESVTAGRKYVEAYVTFVHYVERLHQDIADSAGEHQH